MKKMFKMIFVLTLLVSLSACSAVIAEKRENYAGKILTGQISEIDDTTVYLQLGKLKKADNDEMKDDLQQMPQFEDGEQPELPEDFDGQMPEDLKGEAPAGSNDQMPGQFGPRSGNRPEMTEGERPEKAEGLEGERPQMPEGFEGQMPQGDPGQMTGEGDSMMPQMKGMKLNSTVYTFKKKSQTASIDLKGAQVTLSDGSSGTVSDLKTGDVVQITVDENNNVASVFVVEVNEITEE